MHNLERKGKKKKKKTALIWNSSWYVAYTWVVGGGVGRLTDLDL